MLRLLDRYRTKQFVPRRVLQMTISYVTLAYASLYLHVQFFQLPPVQR